MGGTEPPKVELTEEDKKINFRAPKTKDLADNVLTKWFGQFSMPEKSEGFDEIQYEWQNEKVSTEYLQKWRREKKLNTTVNDLQPGEWFKTTLTEFQKTTDEYKAKQKAFKAKKPAKAKKADDEEEEQRGEEKDLFEVSDVNDIGNGEPLYSNFSFEDWAIFTLRYELFLLTEGFKKDVNDAERVGIPEAHFSYYYNKYFKRSLQPKMYKKDDLASLLKDYVKDTVALQDGLLVRKLAEAASSEAADFVKLQEEARRERQRRLDAGDESVRIKFDGLEKQMDAAKKQAADEERKKKQAEDNKKHREEAAAKAKADAEKRAAQEKNKPPTQAAKPAAQAAKPAQKATWNSSAGKETSKPTATWNSGSAKQATWSSDKQGSWGSQSKGKGGGKGKW